jgi:hypothetical protein
LPWVYPIVPPVWGKIFFLQVICSSTYFKYHIINSVISLSIDFICLIVDVPSDIVSDQHQVSSPWRRYNSMSGRFHVIRLSWSNSVLINSMETNWTYFYKISHWVRMNFLATKRALCFKFWGSCHFKNMPLFTFLSLNNLTSVDCTIN